jgi:Tfp pilus assembly protein PilN
MINLLPTDYRTRLRYGRMNARLRHWIEIGVFLIVGLIIILAMGWLYIEDQISNLNHSVAQTESQLQAQNLQKVQKQADQISQNVRTINQVLGRELRFSDLIQEIGKVMPPGTILGTLTLSNKVTGTLDLSAGAKDYASAAQVAVNLSDPKNNIFAKVDIVNVNCAAIGNAYPCSATFRALFDQKTPEKFLNVSSGAGQ